MIIRLAQPAWQPLQGGAESFQAFFAERFNALLRSVDLFSRNSSDLNFLFNAGCMSGVPFDRNQLL
jgi:hypothetical protein